MADLFPIEVHLLPSLIRAGSMSTGVAVVIDVLRATTVMTHALAAGCQAIVACREIEEARDVAARLGRDQVVLAGEREGLPIEGFDLANSPSTFTPEVCGDKIIVMTTTNGTRAIHASLEAHRVLVAGFVNFAAVSRILDSIRRPIHIVCAGTSGRVSLEDTLLAGALVDHLVGRGFEAGDDSALIARSLFVERGLTTGDGPTRDAKLAAVLREGRGGKRNIELGTGADVVDAAHWDRFAVVGGLDRTTGHIVRVSAFDVD